MSQKKNAVVIDGNSLSYRAFYATFNQLNYFKNKNIKPNNAIKLMLIMSLKILNEYNPDYALVAFDAGKKTFRNEIYDAYKANRDVTPAELIFQLPLIQKSLKLSGFNIELKQGVEADDIIGSFVNLANKNNIVCKIFSSDKDMLQLVNDLTCVYQPKKGISELQIYDSNNFETLTEGLKPIQIIDYKSIVGDSSDNIPGIKGIGKKIGINLLKKYGCLENIYEHINELSPSQQRMFNESKEIAKQCKILATIKNDLFVNVNIDNYLRHNMQTQELINLLKKCKINNMEKYIFNV